MNTSLMFSSERQDWETPQKLFDVLDTEFQFSLDVCATAENAKCQKYFTPEQNGLLQSWVKVAKSFCLPCVFWMNPPYGREIGKWVQKAYEESLKGATVICLLPARTDTRWFHQFIYDKAEIRFLKGRLKFSKAKNAAPFPSMVVVFGNAEKKGDKANEMPSMR